MNFRRSKIVCTLGPASDSPRCIEQLIRSGMDVVRLNFSHGTHEWHLRTMKRIREAASARKNQSPFLPTLAALKFGPAHWWAAFASCFSPDSDSEFPPAIEPGDASGIFTTFKPLPQEVHRGGRILLADGLIELRVMSVRRREVICEVRERRRTRRASGNQSAGNGTQGSFSSAERLCRSGFRPRIMA